MTFKTILMDPPWWESGGGKIKRGANRHYTLVKTKDMPGEIFKSPLWDPDMDGCSIWMWATVNHLPDALWVMKNIGAKYVTNAVWVKAQPVLEVGDRFSHPPMVKPQHAGLGQRMRICHEHLLYGRIGKVPVPSPEYRLPSVIYAPRTRHSEKPDESYVLIQTHDGPGPKAELFARRHRLGWECDGEELAA